MFGFVSERLLDAWLITNNIAYEELDVVYMESQHWLRKGMAFLNRSLLPTRRLTNETHGSGYCNV